jgi:hypothetical protein
MEINIDGGPRDPAGGILIGSRELSFILVPPPAFEPIIVNIHVCHPATPMRILCELEQALYIMNYKYTRTGIAQSV